MNNVLEIDELLVFLTSIEIGMKKSLKVRPNNSTKTKLDLVVKLKNRLKSSPDNIRVPFDIRSPPHVSLGCNERKCMSHQPMGVVKIEEQLNQALAYMDGKEDENRRKTFDVISSDPCKDERLQFDTAILGKINKDSLDEELSDEYDSLGTSTAKSESMPSDDLDLSTDESKIPSIQERRRCMERKYSSCIDDSEGTSYITDSDEESVEEESCLELYGPYPSAFRFLTYRPLVPQPPHQKLSRMQSRIKILKAV